MLYIHTIVTTKHNALLTRQVVMYQQLKISYHLTVANPNSDITILLTANKRGVLFTTNNIAKENWLSVEYQNINRNEKNVVGSTRRP